jgi:hypothetical protein
MVPVTVALSTAGRVMERMLIVRLRPLTPIQVAGA